MSLKKENMRISMKIKLNSSKFPTMHGIWKQA